MPLEKGVWTASCPGETTIQSAFQGPVDGPHEFDLEFGTEEAFEATLNLWVL